MMGFKKIDDPYRDKLIRKNVGVRVYYYSTEGYSRKIATKTRSKPWLLDNGIEIVLVDNIVGGVDLRHLELREQKDD